MNTDAQNNKFNEVEFLTKASECQQSIGDEVYDNLCKLIQVTFDVRAVSFYSFLKSTNVYSLRAFSGFKVEDYSQLTIKADAIAIESVKQNKVCLIEDVSDANGYNNKRLVEKYQLKKMICVPIFSANLFSERKSWQGEILGIFCIYPNSGADTEVLVSACERFSSLIAQTIKSSVSYSRLIFLDQLRSCILTSKDIGSFFHKTLDVAKNFCNIEAASIFIYDDRSSILRLSKTTGLKASKENSENREIFYRLSDTNNTVSAFIKGYTHAHIWGKGDSVKLRFLEKLKGARKASLYIPISVSQNVIERISKNNPNHNCYGVLRLVNRSVKFGSNKHSSCFGWEDVYMAEFMAELLAIQSYAYESIMKKEHIVEKSLHSLQSNVMAVLGNLEILQERAGIKDNISSLFSYTIPNSLAQLESINQQLTMFSTGAINFKSINLEGIKLGGEVMSKIREFAQKIKYNYGVERVDLDLDSFLGERIRKLPLVLGNSEMCLNLLKNIVENAIKYSGSNFCKIKFDWKREDEFLSVFVSDEGIGIPDDEMEYVFYEGYQAPNGRELRTSGTGVGLYQCKVIIELMEGNIEVMKESISGTAICIKFRIWNHKI